MSRLSLNLIADDTMESVSTFSILVLTQVILKNWWFSVVICSTRFNFLIIPKVELTSFCSNILRSRGTRKPYNISITCHAVLLQKPNVPSDIQRRVYISLGECRYSQDYNKPEIKETFQLIMWYVNITFSKRPSFLNFLIPWCDLSFQ